MRGQTKGDNIYRMERQFRHGDSVKIVRKQVEKYEDLVREQSERSEHVRRYEEEVERFKKEVEAVK